ncbi:MAG: PQQ-binding-like beta-propeller repeat protein [Leadbetterella sp.]|nr:PQQ-binding-like beta-propeller repeat protein [Leadbetterella sp.]
MKAQLKTLVCFVLFAACSGNDPVKDPDLPIAGFTFEIKEKGVVNFNSTSEFTEEHAWEFGDGKTSTEKNPAHTFGKNGEYKVTLTAKNPHGNHKASETLMISDLHPPVADFTFENKGKGVVEFRSTAAYAKEYSWDFGNGKSSLVANPSHTYENNGEYPVSLTVKNEYGTDTKTRVLTLNNVNLPQAGFTFVIDKGKVTFTNTSQFSDSYVWSFGDGKTATEQHPAHTYTENRSYTVRLTAKSGIGEHSAEKQVTITGVPPQTANQLLYVSNYSDKQLIQALDASSGEIQWSRDGFDGRVHGALSRVGGTLYFTTDQSLYAVDAANGNTRWRFPAGSPASPVVLNNVVYFGASDSKIYAVNTSNGSKKWELQVAAPVSASVIIHNNVLFVGTNAPGSGGGGTFYAVNIADGSVKWQRGTYGGSMNTRAQIAGSNVYFGGSVGLHILNKDNGAGHEGLIAYSFRQVQHSSPIVSDNHVFALFGGSEFSRVDVGSDVALWTHNLNSSGNTASPVLVGNTLYISGQNRVYALNKGNGNVTWSFQGSNFNSRNVTYANNIIYVADNKGSSSELVALNAGNGSVIFRTTLTGVLGDMTVLAKDGKVTYPGSTGQP